MQPLNYGILKQYKEVVDAYLTPPAPGETAMDITARAAAFLGLAGISGESMPPVEIAASALA